MHVATDGESYGHHHKYGEMALAYALRLLEQDKTVKLTNYASFPRAVSARVRVRDCRQHFMELRARRGALALQLRLQRRHARLEPGMARAAAPGARRAARRAGPAHRAEGGKLFRDVWAARDAYIQVVLDRSAESVDRFFAAHQAHPLNEAERVRALELMEMQRHAQLMYTSCGWFFDDIAGIETVQVIAYAARVLQLASRFSASRPRRSSPHFSRAWPKPTPTIPLPATAPKSTRNASTPWSCTSSRSPRTTPSAPCSPRLPMRRSSSASTSAASPTRFIPRAAAAWRWAAYTSPAPSPVTRKAFHSRFFTSATRTSPPPSRPTATADAAAFEAFAAEAAEHVQRADFPEVIRLLDRYYGHADYSLTSLFTDEQRRIVQLILNSTLWDIENSLTTIYQDHASLLHYLSQAGLPKPPALNLAASFAVNAGLRRVLEGDPIDQAQLRSYLALAKADQVPLDTATLSYIADQRMKRAMVELQMSSGSLEMLDRALALARTLTELPFELNLWQAQNIWYEILRTPATRSRRSPQEERPRWKKDFNELGACLSFDTEAIRALEEADAAMAND